MSLTGVLSSRPAPQGLPPMVLKGYGHTSLRSTSALEVGAQLEPFHQRLGSLARGISRHTLGVALDQRTFSRSGRDRKQEARVQTSMPRSLDGRPRCRRTRWRAVLVARRAPEDVLVASATVAGSSLAEALGLQVNQAVTVRNAPVEVWAVSNRRVSEFLVAKRGACAAAHRRSRTCRLRRTQ